MQTEDTESHFCFPPVNPFGQLVILGCCCKCNSNSQTKVPNVELQGAEQLVTPSHTTKLEPPTTVIPDTAPKPQPLGEEMKT